MIIKITRDERRWTQDRNIRNCYGETEFDSKYLLRRVTLRIFGIPVFFWYEDVRPIAVHEWAIAALGERPRYEDNPKGTGRNKHV